MVFIYNRIIQVFICDAFDYIKPTNTFQLTKVLKVGRILASFIMSCYFLSNKISALLISFRTGAYEVCNL